MKNKMFLVILIAIFFIANAKGQNYIGTFEVSQVNNNFFYIAGSKSIPIDKEHIILKYVSSTSSATITSFEQSNNLSTYGEFDGYYIYKLPSGINY